MNAIYFDWDGTLADSMDLCVSEMRETFRLMGLPDRTDEEFRRCNGPTPPDSAPMMGIPPERTEEYLAIRRRVGVEMIAAHQKLFPGTAELLRSLADQAVLSIVSNGNGPYIRESAKACGVADCFTRIQASVPGKTKGELLRGLLEEMKPDRAVMVGDMKGDFLAGHQNGLITLCADYGFGGPEEKAMADAHAASPLELRRWLENWCRG